MPADGTTEAAVRSHLSVVGGQHSAAHVTGMAMIPMPRRCCTDRLPVLDGYVTGPDLNGVREVAVWCHRCQGLVQVDLPWVNSYFEARIAGRVADAPASTDAQRSEAICERARLQVWVSQMTAAQPFTPRARAAKRRTPARQSTTRRRAA